MATLKVIATIRITMTARLIHAPTISWSRVESSLGNLQPGDHLPKRGEAHAVQPAVVGVVDENLGGYPDIVTCSAAPPIPTVWLTWLVRVSGPAVAKLMLPRVLLPTTGSSRMGLCSHLSFCSSDPEIPNWRTKPGTTRKSALSL